MTMRVRAVLVLTAALAMMSMAGCDHYNCGSGANFGSSSCSAGGGGLSQGGGGTTGGNSELALAYYVSNTEIGGLELSSTDALIYTPDFVFPTLGTSYTNSGMVIAQEQFLYVPYSFGTGQLFAYSIDASTGALTALAGSPYSATYAAGLPFSTSQPTTPIITNPAGTLLFVADATDSQIAVYQVSSTGALTGPTLFSTGTVQPWNLSTDGLGRFLYVAEGNTYGEGVQMAVYAIDSTTGALSGGTTMAFDMWQVQGEPTGQFMVGTDGLSGFTNDGKLPDNNLYVFSINSTTGVLTQTGAFVTANGPTAVLVSPNGQYVYDFSVVKSTGFDGPLEGFSFSNGTLTPLLGSPFSALTVPYGGFFDQSGTNLFIHTAGAIGVFTVDTTTGIPTEPNTPIGVGSGAVIYPWAVTDPL